MSFKVSAKVISEEGRAVNCRICGGEIKPFLSPAPFLSQIPANVSFVYYADATGRFFASDEKNVYASGNGVTYSLLSALEGKPFSLEDISGENARTLIISGKYAVAHDGNSFTSFEYGANLSCGVMHCGRLFGADADDGLTLRWSGEGGVRDWERGLYKSGYLKLDPELGIILDLVEYGGRIVAVRRFGLTVFNMFGNAENFAVASNIPVHCKIYGGTAKAAGNKLYFFTECGLKEFDGGAAAEVKHVYAGELHSPACAAAWDGKYFLSCGVKVGRAVFCYDGERAALIDAEADCMCSADRLYIFNSSGGFTLEEGGNYTYRSRELFFGTQKYKTLCKLFIDGTADITVSNGRISRVFVGARGVVRPRLRGKSFTFTLSGKGEVKSLIAEAEVLSEI